MSLHEQPGKVYWAELQSELGDAGLNVVVDLPFEPGPWSGLIDEKPFLMSIPTKDREDGKRPWMLVSLFGQDEDEILPKLTAFMGYSPFARYRWQGNEDITASYEWDKDPNTKIEQLQTSERIRDLQLLETGLIVDEKPIEEMFAQVTPEVAEMWEQAVKRDPRVEFVGKPIAPFLPFLREVLPRISNQQSLLGLSLVSLDHTPERVEEIVRYAIEPLVAAGILTEDDVRKIVGWFKISDPAWEPEQTKEYGFGFKKGFEVGGTEYTLTTHSYRGYKDLNVVEGSENLTEEERLMRIIADSF